MKRGAVDYPEEESDYNNKRKKMNLVEEDDVKSSDARMSLNEDLLFEVLKHVDAKTLGRSACVSRTWRMTARDERLWEMICTRQWANIGNNDRQLRSVVLALGGFRRLHSLYLWPISRIQPSSPASAAASSSYAWSSFAPMMGSKPPAKWGKDEIHLSLSLLSIRFYEKMNFAGRGR